jgi:hypothetical protein
MRHSWLAWVAAAGLTTGTQAAPVEALPAGSYLGTYVCPQGETALMLTVNAPAGGQQTAEFAFGGNNGLPSGAYVVLVQADNAGAIILTPQHWLQQPEGYDMVGAELRRDGGQLTGTITDPNCLEVALQRLGGTGDDDMR